jgi:nucleotide-binding universal stress UspA family protein
MYRSIIAPLDGSTFSERALPLAARLAAQSGATLQLVRVEAPFVSSNVSVREALREAPDPEVQTYLDRIAQQLTANRELRVATALLHGPVEDTLTRFVAEQQPDLIVMTTHGHSGLARAWIGSIAETLVRRSHIPILLIRPAHDDAPAAADLRHIAIPLDGSALSEQVLPVALALGELTQASYTLLQVVEPPTAAGAGYAALGYRAALELGELDELRSAAQQYLDELAQRLRADGRQVQTRVLVHPSIASALREDAARHGIDAFAMATHARAGLARLLIGSTAAAMLHDTALPALLYRPQERQDQERA